MFFVYFGLPAFQVTLTERLAAVLALSLYSGAYMTEIFRAGILAVGHGQVEAGQALGLTGFQISRTVVLPQAFRVVLPALGNQFISLIKDSSLAVAISVRELTYAAVRINDISWRIVEVYSVIAGMYLVVTWTVAVGLRGLKTCSASGAEEASHDGPGSRYRRMEAHGPGPGHDPPGLDLGHGPGTGRWPAGRPGVALRAAAVAPGGARIRGFRARHAAVGADLLDLLRHSGGGHSGTQLPRGGDFAGCLRRRPDQRVGTWRHQLHSAGTNRRLDGVGPDVLAAADQGCLATSGRAHPATPR